MGLSQDLDLGETADSHLTLIVNQPLKILMGVSIQTPSNFLNVDFDLNNFRALVPKITKQHFLKLLDE